MWQKLSLRARINVLLALVLTLGLAVNVARLVLEHIVATAATSVSVPTLTATMTPTPTLAQSALGTPVIGPLTYTYSDLAFRGVRDGRVAEMTVDRLAFTMATPADAALMMQLGAEGNFVGSGIFKSSDPARRARAIVEATTHFDDPERVAAASIGLGEAMPGLEISDLAAEDALLQNRGA